MKVGVVVGRFQVPMLTSAHMSLLEHAADQNDMLIVVVGTTMVRGDLHDPLPFDCVRINIEDRLLFNSNHVKLKILKLEDHPSDSTWNRNLDELITQNTSLEDDVTLYGGRDSFLKCYDGKFATANVIIHDDSSGTESRKIWQQKTIDVLNDEAWMDLDRFAAFNAGIIHGSSLLYPTSYQCVDILAHVDRKHIVLIRKPGCKQWQLPGGFVDVADKTLEEAALRELEEETKIRGTLAKYFTSHRIDDYRYMNRRDKVMTTLFEVPVNLTDVLNMRASDDAEEVDTFILQDVAETWDKQHILSGHHQMIKEWFKRCKSAN